MGLSGVLGLGRGRVGGCERKRVSGHPDSKSNDVQLHHLVSGDPPALGQGGVATFTDRMRTLFKVTTLALMAADFIPISRSTRPTCLERNSRVLERVMVDFFIWGGGRLEWFPLFLDLCVL